MKERMTKRFFAPLWKCEEIESELSRLEQEGWRLDKISGFRKFEFVKAKPKNATYFFTYWTKARNMYDYEASLRREYKALPIMIKGANTMRIHRIPEDVDLTPYKRPRNFFLRYLVLQYVWVGLIFLVLSIAAAILSSTVAELIFPSLLAAFSATVFFPNLFGWIYLRKQYKKRQAFYPCVKGKQKMKKEEFLSTIKSYSTPNLSDGSDNSIDYWYPVQDVRKDIPVIAFDLWKIYDDIHAIKQIEAVLSHLSIETATVIQNQDFNNEPKTVNLKALLYESDKDGYNFPWYVESYYYDHSKQWMIYTSHEFTITFAGEEIVRAARKIIDPEYFIKR